VPPFGWLYWLSWFYRLGEWRPVFFVPPLFVPRLFDSALIRCPHAPTRTHDFSRVPMGSHL